MSEPKTIAGYPLLIEGMTPEAHRLRYPSRWSKITRAWPTFWGSLVIVPMVLFLNWAVGTTWDMADSGLVTGWITARFFTALQGQPAGLKTIWSLDKPTAWQRARNHLQGEQT